MVRRRNQKGAGLLNWFRGLTRSRKIAPAPQETKTRRINIKDEAYIDSLRRVYVFFYYKLKGQEPPREKRFLSPQQEAEVRRILLTADAAGKTDDEIADEFFQTELLELDSQLRLWETYAPEFYLNKGTPYERRAFPVAKSLGRFIATIKSSPKNIRYTSNFMVHQCEIAERDQYVKSLSDDYCVTILTESSKEDYEAQKGEIYPVSYIVIKPEFYPKGTTGGGPLSVSAKRLPVISFLLDAFQQGGIVEVEKNLLKTIEREAPELLQFSQQNPVILLSPIYLTDPSTTKGRFIVLDTDFFWRGRNVINLKEVAKSYKLQNGFAKRKIYIMDPKTMYLVRESLTPLWLANFGSANMKVYKTLTPHEKLVFCLLQYKKFLEYYSLYRDFINNNDRERTTEKIESALRKARKEVFELNYESSGNPFDLLEAYGIQQEGNWKELKQIQKEVLGSVEIETPEQLGRLIQKFRRVTGPTRKQRVKMMLNPMEIQTQRSALMKRLQNTLKQPIKTSILPNFLRTRKAKEANKQRWKEKVETARKELLTFNEQHGISTVNRNATG